MVITQFWTAKAVYIVRKLLSMRASIQLGRFVFKFVTDKIAYQLSKYLSIERVYKRLEVTTCVATKLLK